MAKPPQSNTEPTVRPADGLTYEQAIAELEGIIDRIESGEIGLEESVKAYERGVALQNHCKAILARAEQRVSELTPGSEPPGA